MALWALFAARRTIRGVVFAADGDQAGIIIQIAQGIIGANPWLAAVLDVQRWVVRNKHTGSELKVITSDVGSSFGLLVDFVCCDEVTCWTDRGLWDSLLSSAAKRPHCLMACILNAGFVESWQHQVRQAVRSDPRWYFSHLDRPCASWISRETLAEQERLLPSVAYRRLWLNEWSEGAGDALDAAAIDAAVRLAGPPAFDPGCCYVGGLDLSLSRDASAFVVVSKSVGWQESRPVERAIPRHVELLEDLGILDAAHGDSESVYHSGDGRLRLAHVMVWRPNRGKIDLEAIERHVLGVHSRLPLSGLVADVYQAELLCQRLRRAGVPATGIHLVPSILQNVASATLDAFRDSTLDLYKHGDLLADLKMLRVHEYRDGRAFKLESPRRNTEAGEGTRHGDAASALGLALYGARWAQPATAGHLGSLVYS
jgi:hypothetical protein